MISLTQDKREELIACANEIKKMATDTHNYKVGNDVFGKNAITLMEIVLASLTSVSVLHAVDSDVEDKIYTTLCNEHEYGAYPLFTSPPVPEIKLPKIPDGELVYSTTGGDMMIPKYELEAFVAEIKRLNGLGE